MGLKAPECPGLQPPGGSSSQQPAASSSHLGLSRVLQLRPSSARAGSAPRLLSDSSRSGAPPGAVLRTARERGGRRHEPLLGPRAWAPRTGWQGQGNSGRPPSRYHPLQGARVHGLGSVRSRIGQEGEARSLPGF